MMGVSLWLLWKSEAEASPKKLAIGLFFIQLALNAAWAPVFFGLHQPWLALAIIVALGFCIIATIAAALPVNRAASVALYPLPGVGDLCDGAQWGDSRSQLMIALCLRTWLRSRIRRDRAQDPDEKCR